MSCHCCAWDALGQSAAAAQKVLGRLVLSFLPPHVTLGIPGGGAALAHCGSLLVRDSSVHHVSASLLPSSASVSGLLTALPRGVLQVEDETEPFADSCLSSTT